MGHDAARAELPLAHGTDRQRHCFGTKPRLSSECGTAMLVARSIFEASKYYALFQKTVFKVTTPSLRPTIRRPAISRWRILARPTKRTSAIAKLNKPGRFRNLL